MQSSKDCPGRSLVERKKKKRPGVPISSAVRKTCQQDCLTWTGSIIGDLHSWLKIEDYLIQKVEQRQRSRNVNEQTQETARNPKASGLEDMRREWHHMLGLERAYHLRLFLSVLRRTMKKQRPVWLHVFLNLGLWGEEKGKGEGEKEFILFSKNSIYIFTCSWVHNIERNINCCFTYVCID